MIEMNEKPGPYALLIIVNWDYELIRLASVSGNFVDCRVWRLSYACIYLFAIYRKRATLMMFHLQTFIYQVLLKFRNMYIWFELISFLRSPRVNALSGIVHCNLVVYLSPCPCLLCDTSHCKISFSACH